MSLQPIKLRPGIDRSGTDYSNEGGYFACDKVRFRFGRPQKIGGWVKYTRETFEGTCRALFNWVTTNSTNLLAVATNVKCYVENSGTFNDITPVRHTAVLTPSPFAAVVGSNDLTVHDANHGAANGDYVTFSGATAFAGLTPSDLNQEFQLTFIDINNYTVTLAVPATASASGGGTPTAAYQIVTTPNVSVPGKGWNAGAWGRGAWGSAATSSTFTSLRLWSLEAFGEDLVFCPRNGALYYWQFSQGLTHRAVLLSSLPGALDVPELATKLIMSTQDRHLIALGCNAVGETDQDPLLIRWADTESPVNWRAQVTNAAGELRCSSGNYIVTGVRLKQEILIFTDSSIFSMQFIGAPFIFGLVPTADNISIISGNATAIANGSVFWMGNDKFYLYNGGITTIPCPLEDTIFKDINKQQADQIFAGTNEGFSEVWWFYCSASSTVNDRYVVFNYQDGIWYYGTLNRTAWLDTPLKRFPIAAANSLLYQHESGTDDDRTTPINAWIESSDFNIDTGEHYSFLTRILPDVSFVGSNTAAPAVTLTLTPRNTPGGAYRSGVASPVVRSVAVPIEQFTEQCDVRLRGRQMKLRIESTGLGVHWRMGIPRIDIQPDGKK